MAGTSHRPPWGTAEKGVYVSYPHACWVKQVSGLAALHNAEAVAKMSGWYTTREKVGNTIRLRISEKRW